MVNYFVAKALTLSWSELQTQIADAPPIKSAYIVRSPQLFGEEGVYEMLSGETVYWFFLSPRKDLTLPGDKKEKALYMASTGADFLKTWAGPICTSTFGALTGIGGIGGVVGSVGGVMSQAAGLSADAGGGFMKTGEVGKDQKAWQKELRHKVRGTRLGEDHAFEFDLVMGGCASVTFDRAWVSIRARIWKKEHFLKFLGFVEGNGNVEYRAHLTLEYAAGGEEMTISFADQYEVQGQGHDVNL